MSKLDERDFDDEPPTTVMKTEQLQELAARTRGEFPKLSESAETFSDDPTAIAKLSAAEILAAAGETPAVALAPVLEPEPVPRWRPWQDSTVLMIAAAIVALLAVMAVHD